ncbi:MAG: aminodeoxychorismate/anthranilate synthase component II [Deltaproteobacteria bacterium]|nr:aminodeoxychorismate/anthranilate synthase component II [Deltaproteobacteria bacterium]
MTARRPRVALVDHYDSFTHNLVHALARAGADCTVLLHDRATVAEVLAYDGVVLSAGPCSPRETAVTLPVIRALAAQPGPPLLGVCLGHQCIAEALGGKVGRSRSPLHGRVAMVTHDGRGVFEGLPNPSPFARYNSLTVTKLGPDLEATASDEQGELMALRHPRLAMEGVQFHPESHLSRDGAPLLARWVARVSHALGLQARGE